MRKTTRPTDDVITSMLVHRSASPMPPDLAGSVLAGVHDARRREGRRSGRPGVLLVAAALLVAGSLGVAAVAGSRVTLPFSPLPAPAVVPTPALPAVVIQPTWITDGSTAFTVTRDTSDQARLYWRARIYDRIDLNGYSSSATTSIARAAAAPLFDQLADDVDRIGRRDLTFTIAPDGFRDTTILSPATPVTVSERTNLQVVGEGGYFSGLERVGGSGPYTVNAVIAESGNGPGQLNLAALRATGLKYPQDVIELYLQVPPDSLGPNARALQAKVLEQAATSAPVDLANALAHVLDSPEFTYSVDVRGVDCAELSTVECFATYKIGFCRHFATTMAVILRDLGVPTRIVEGFLPGSREGSASVEVVANRNAFAWVEVYFSDVGWVTYDPTGAHLATQIAPLASGSPAAAP